MAIYKIFGGVKFRLGGDHLNKSDANYLAHIYRKEGKKARVIKTKDKTFSIGYSYSVYHK